MEKKQTKKLTEFERKYIEEEVKNIKAFNEYLATTNFKVSTYKKPQQKKGGASDDKK